jgi:hypothetical protein
MQWPQWCGMIRTSLAGCVWSAIFVCTTARARHTGIAFRQTQWQWAEVPGARTRDHRRDATLSVQCHGPSDQQLSGSLQIGNDSVSFLSWSLSHSHGHGIFTLATYAKGRWKTNPNTLSPQFLTSSSPETQQYIYILAPNSLGVILTCFNMPSHTWGPATVTVTDSWYHTMIAFVLAVSNTGKCKINCNLQPASRHGIQKRIF